MSPPNSPQYAVISRIDPELLAYAADTANFAHTAAQGPYYIGPWYVNEAGQRIDGAYVDVSLAHAVDLQARRPSTASCTPRASTPTRRRAPTQSCCGPAYADGNYFYGGCVNDAAASSAAGPRPVAGPAGLSEAAR